jgi:membrane associated rhomboid family serine protease
MPFPLVTTGGLPRNFKQVVKMHATSVLLVSQVVLFLLTWLPPDISPWAADLLDHGVSKAWTLDSESPIGRPVREGVWNGEVWRLLTAIFLHANPLHLILNLYGLYVLGPALETAVGTTRFLLIYFLSGIFGYVVSLVFLHPLAATLGASGAIFGLMGALIGNEMRFGRHPLEFLEQDYGRSLVSYAVLNLVLGLLFPGINNAAHLGGFLCGLLLMQCGLVRLTRPPGRAGWALRIAMVLFCLEVVLYSAFPVFDGYWQFNRALVARERNEPGAMDAALRRVQRIDPNLMDELALRGYYQEVILELYRWREKTTER